MQKRTLNLLNSKLAFCSEGDLLFIVLIDNKCACTLLLMVTLPLSTKAICYANILEKTAQNKGQSLFYPITHARKSMENYLSAV